MNTAISATFTRDYLNKITRSCVYFFMRGDEVRYVGVARSGFERFASRNHHARERSRFDSVKVFWFREYETAKVAEAIAIGWLRPPVNGSKHQYRGNGQPNTANDDLNRWLLECGKPNADHVGYKEIDDRRVLECISNHCDLSATEISTCLGMGKGRTCESLKRLLQTLKIVRRPRIKNRGNPAFIHQVNRDLGLRSEAA